MKFSELDINTQFKIKGDLVLQDVLLQKQEEETAIIVHELLLSPDQEVEVEVVE